MFLKDIVQIIYKGGIVMGVYAIKSEKPIVTTKPLVRNTVNQDYMNWVNYMNTHDFTFKIDGDNNLKVKATKNK